jgi:hypothetical protein
MRYPLFRTSQETWRISIWIARIPGNIKSKGAQSKLTANRSRSWKKPGKISIRGIAMKATMGKLRMELRIFLRYWRRQRRLRISSRLPPQSFLKINCKPWWAWQIYWVGREEVNWHEKKTSPGSPSKSKVEWALQETLTLASYAEAPLLWGGQMS